MDNSSQKIGIFLEPSGDLRDLIVAQKAKVEAELPGQVFCDHPPHATFIFGGYHSSDIWLEYLLDRILPTFTVTVDGYHLFPNDTLAGGGHTLVHRLQSCSAMLEIQQEAAELLEDFVEQPGGEAEPPWGEPLRTSMQRFGFPFVGEHWIPHMTIASFQTPLDHELIAELQQQPNKGLSFEAKELAVWQLIGSEHRLLETIPLHPST